MYRSSILIICLIAFSFVSLAQVRSAFPYTVNQTTTYKDCIAFYKQLDEASPQAVLLEEGSTDAGLPLHLILFSNKQTFDPAKWDRKNTLVILINNGIHPGEPDGIDASMMLMHDLVAGVAKIPDNVIIAIIPIYNIGGVLNRNDEGFGSTRVNQNGPEEYGFRGNSQNLDLNRDFTKTDSKEAASFARIFHWLDPNVFIDTHVSDGADYQHMMTLLSTQYDKLGGTLGTLMRKELDPALYKTMKAKKDSMIPYVNVEESTPDKGWIAFNDPPRFSSGYSALWQCIAYVPETHMLKPFPMRVNSTYRLLRTFLEQCAEYAPKIIAAREKDRAALAAQTTFYLDWVPDTTKATSYLFSGYYPAYKPSEVTGAKRLYYDHGQPFYKPIPIHDFYKGRNPVKAPQAYVMTQAWAPVIERLQQQGVIMHQFTEDTSVLTKPYYIETYDTRPGPYEKHYKHTHITTKTDTLQMVKLRKGDYLIPVQQPAKRFIIEMLEPSGEDSYFAWNFFDGILQQKEGYSDYRWEDVASSYLVEHPSLREELEKLKKKDKSFTPEKQLRWVYEHSSWFEREYKRYPVYRLE